MLGPFTIRYALRPKRRSLATGEVADTFGLPPDEPPYTVVENLLLDVRPGDVVLITGPSGSGKSSLLRALAEQLGATDAAALALPDEPLVDTLAGSVPERLGVLAGCGLSEARLWLRTPAELSEGQRYRYRLAWALSRTPAGGWVAADEFTATLDRTLARVVAHALRRQAARAQVGLLAATTHEDVATDLLPDVWVRCHGEGRVTVERRLSDDRGRLRRVVSFADELWLSEGTRADWPYFARWHYRGRGLGFVRRVIVLWHGREPVGICVFASPAASLSLRSRYFGLRGPRDRLTLAAVNDRLWLLQRVVLHPTYRGAGIAAPFVRRACRLCPVDWIEALAVMGHANPFFERAGFVRVGVIRKRQRQHRSRGHGAFVGRLGRPAVPADDHPFSEPVYYVFDNRGRTTCPPDARPATGVSGPAASPYRLLQSPHLDGSLP